MTDRARPTPPPQVNVRLWILVSVLLLAVPSGIITARQLSTPSDAAAEPLPAQTAPVEPSAPELAPEPPASEPAPPTATEPTPSAPPATPSPPPAQKEPTQKKPAKPKTTPPKTALPKTGPAKYVTASATAKPATTKGRRVRYRVRVEKNLPIDANEAARQTARTLNDKRSWTGDGSVRFELVGRGKADLTIYLLTAGTTDRRCYPLRTFGKVSCQQGASVNLNAERWVGGVSYYGSDVAGYRIYLVNHEVGHYLGRGHVSCPAPGRRAPIMMQQTKGLQGCRANPWVKPSR